ncbi:DNA recombination protein RmuC [Burkholderiaceae bacterium FT117]|uniref:DNA recombination protein RmuC n=1 Tax=Zeimonas sediminis TaxID=2944268 RepID=UPI0023430293|nr:DNA recombination protein RmuC [Zeimonas sediminis]MCM5571862.1 DNA recombination protein RmuC [Zeimonas sediminis]
MLNAIADLASSSPRAVLAVLAGIGVLLFALGWAFGALPGRGRIAASRATLDERSGSLERALEQRDAALADARGLAERVAGLRAALDAERRQSGEKLRLLADARQQLADQFRALAAEVLDEKARAVGERHREQLGQLLEPLQQRLAEFRSRVDEVYEREGRERAALGEQVRQLMSLNRQLSDDAHALTRALKGQVKTQGAWGELILERVLEAAGLRRGSEYELQVSLADDAGRRLQPDAVVRLPEERVLVIDAKVSLLAWSEHVNAADDAVRADSMRRHVDSIRGHVKGLAGRGYEQLHGARSPDFVVMFVPVEAAFSAALAHDDALWHEAWQRNVLIVGPASLLFVVRTVAQLWRQARQDRNAREIAERGAELYDRFVAFAGDLEKLGERLRQARESYDSAWSRLATGRGNLVRQAEMLRELGVKPSKTLSVETLERAAAEDSDGGAAPAASGLPANEARPAAAENEARPAAAQG